MEESRPNRAYTHSAIQETADRLASHENSAIALTAAGSGAQAAAAGRRRSAMREEDTAAREDDQRAAAAQASINAADSCEFPAQSSVHGSGSYCDRLYICPAAASAMQTKNNQQPRSQ